MTWDPEAWPVEPDENETASLAFDAAAIGMLDAAYEPGWMEKDGLDLEEIVVRYDDTDDCWCLHLGKNRRCKFDSYGQLWDYEGEQLRLLNEDGVIVEVLAR
jgi:hypothetical protein